MGMGRFRAAPALVAVAALVLTACSGGSDDSSGDPAGGGDDGGTGASTGIVTANSSEPQNPLIPTNTNEVGGGRVLDLIFAGLVYYAPDGSAHNEVAESIETEDNQTFTVTLEEGWTFSDGSPVTSSSFVDAWNQGALLSNAHLSSYFFEPIEGFSYEEDSELTGLKVEDDLTFTITLKQPEADFPARLGYSAFFPLPEAAFEDPEAFGENPIGNGPYMLDGEGAWEHNIGIDLVPNEDYPGEREPQNGGVSLIFYDNQDSAYNDLLAGELDIIDEIPDSAFGAFEDELGERAVNQPAALFQSFTIPEYLDHFEGEEGQLRRQAISHAIDREEITETIFQGTRTPAADFTSPVVDGWTDKVPGNEVLTFDADLAQDLWAQANEISPWEGTFLLYYNSDDPHQPWVDAVVNQLRNNLGIEAQGEAYPSLGELRTAVGGKDMDGAFRTGWQADYPLMGNFLGPLYSTGAGSNDGDYSNEDFDALLAQAATAESVDDATGLYIQAQEVLMEDLPAIPLWYQNVVGGSAETVDNVEFGWNSVPVYHAVTKQE